MSTIPSIVPLLPPVTPNVSVGAVAAVAPVALAPSEGMDLPLPVSQALSPSPAAAPETGQDGAAMRPDQVFMSRHVSYPAANGQALAQNWRSMVHNYGTELMNRELRAHAGQLPPAVLVASQDGRVLRQGEAQVNLPPDAWRFTVHAGGPRDQHLRIIGEDADKPPGRRKRHRAALRLELELADGTSVVVQVEAAPGGLVLELSAPDALALARLRALAPLLEETIRRSGLEVLRWRWRDRLPVGSTHARLAFTSAADVLTMPVFRAVAELALVLPLQAEAAMEDYFTRQASVK